MDIEILLNSKLFIAITSALVGIAFSVITQKWLNKRALFTYYVFHNQIGQSTDDQIYGSVKVTWNDNPIARLYLSTVELINESTKDFESVYVRVFTNDTLLLTQRTELSDTTRALDFTEEYKQELFVPEGNQPTDPQLELYRRRRDYLIPTMNRGQKVKFELLNAAKTKEQPTIWLEILQKGINCKYRIAHQLFIGVPQPTAALVGSAIGFVVIGFILFYINNIWLAGILSYAVGMTVLIPGAYAVRIFRKIRDWFTG
jgi:hypothetical protein|tara:strand:+ start:1713 stop:2486 length:774 start_codon:yes stop_codon:yes gene_type:complete